jgi:hypothetical protein
MDTIQDNIVNIIDEKPKRKREPTRKNNTEATAWRRRPDGTYNNRPLDPNYYCKVCYDTSSVPFVSSYDEKGTYKQTSTECNICNKIRNMILQ